VSTGLGHSRHIGRSSGMFAVGTAVTGRPPARIRASGIPARGPHLGCLTAKRIAACRTCSMRSARRKAAIAAQRRVLVPRVAVQPPQPRPRLYALTDNQDAARRGERSVTRLQDAALSGLAEANRIFEPPPARGGNKGKPIWTSKSPAPSVSQLSRQP
jgi:hypothetical protein